MVALTGYVYSQFLFIDFEIRDLTWFGSIYHKKMQEGGMNAERLYHSVQVKEQHVFTAT